MQNSKLRDDISVYDASEYWDEHDFDESADYSEISDFQFISRKKKFVGIDETLYSHIVEKSKKNHISEDDLIHKWLREKVAS